MIKIMTTARQNLSAHCGVMEILDSVKVGDLVTGDPFPLNSYGITNDRMLVGEVIRTSTDGRYFTVKIIEHREPAHLGMEYSSLDAHCFSYCKLVEEVCNSDDCSSNVLKDLF